MGNICENSKLTLIRSNDYTELADKRSKSNYSLVNILNNLESWLIKWNENWRIFSKRGRRSNWKL